jgi:hypothetical protein
MRTIDVLLSGFFGESNRGFLGWSAIYLVTTPSGRRLIFDTGGYNERGTIPKLLEAHGIADEMAMGADASQDHTPASRCPSAPLCRNSRGAMPTTLLNALLKAASDS